MGNYNAGSETNLPFASQPPREYDQQYMKRLVSIINLLVQSSGGSNQIINTDPGDVLVGSFSATLGSLADGATVVAGTIIMNGATVGNAVSVGIAPALASGVYAWAKVTTNNIVTVEILNQSGSPVTPGVVAITVAVVVQ